ncbi:hypothetical protein ABT236_13410 [Streptomyces sp. NPDC001523]|uniref:hypothetical protein n=1 Tax=Streptomyces sp. NPDC001523 TaxID=3154383 RepID=UPI0033208D95
MAIAATVPYLTLKAVWLGGSHLGIPDGSVLLGPGLFFPLMNALSLVMDSGVVLLVLLLTRPWGLRVPARLLTVPVFIATGLLTPIILGFPGQLLMAALGAGPDTAERAAREPFLDPWVFNVVYLGFMIQAVALAGLFVPYARQRWGRRWQGRLGERLPPSTGVVAGAAAVMALAVSATYAYWGFGGTAGQNPTQIARYSSDSAVVFVAYAICVLAAGVGALWLARGGNRRARGPLAVAWIGSSATLSWGVWLSLALLGTGSGPDERPTAATLLLYAAQMIIGLLTATVVTRWLAGRRAA